MGAVISTTNWLDEPGVTLTVATGTMSRPLTDLQIRWGEGLARGTTGGIALLVFDVDLTTAREIVTLGLMGMQGHCDVQFDLGTTVGGAEVFSQVVSYRSDWGFNFGPGCWLHAAAATPWLARYVRIEITIFEGTPTWVDARRLWIGGGLLLSEGMDTGWEVDFKDGSPSERTPDGAVYVSERQRWRRLTTGRTRLTEGQAIGGSGGTTPGLFSQLAKVGRSREIVAAVRSYPSDSDDRLRYFNTVYGQLVGWQPLRNRRGNKFGVDGFEVEEVPQPALS